MIFFKAFADDNGGITVQVTLSDQSDNSVEDPSNADNSEDRTVNCVII